MSGRAGFTLIELATAILVLAVGLATALSMISFGIRQSQDIVDRTTAIHAARAVIDQRDWVDGTRLNTYVVTRTEEEQLVPALPDQEAQVRACTVRVESRGRRVVELTSWRAVLATPPVPEAEP